MARVHVRVDPFHLGSLFSLREAIEALADAQEPALRVIGPVPACRHIALLPGSFNPPTAAHLLLAERALSEGYDCVVFLHAVQTAGKEPSGLIAEDRLMSLRAMADGRCGVGIVSHGLYADQAEAAARAFPDADLSFLVGSDKVFQIFDHAWYADRDAALERLFARAHLVVAPRSDHTERLHGVLAEHPRFARSVSVLRLHPAVGDLSSTRVRGLLHAGADPAGLVPASVAEILTATRAFSPPELVGNEEIDVYALRARLIDRLWRTRGWDAADLDLRMLLTDACSADERGRAWREELADRRAGHGDVAASG